MNHWINDAFFYHLYPLGAFGAPGNNDFASLPISRLNALPGLLDHLEQLGVNAIYLGPLFESTSHGYDTASFYHVDRRLGTNDDLTGVVSAFHKRGIRVILDGVFHHVGRDFWAFRNVLEHGEASPYIGWFDGLNFQGRSPYGDPFSYNGWAGNYNLVKLNLANNEVLDHLFSAVDMWVRDFNIDGLRLDVADCLPHDFMHKLAAFCKSRRSDFWLMGEVIHGDYRKWTSQGHLDSVTNYECYKGLYSSHADKNYFEIAFSLNRQFGKEGIYRGLQLYNFLDNHDVDRIIDTLCKPSHLYPVNLLMFTMPGVPSVYYGSEWGIRGKRTHDSDHALRPQFDWERIARESHHKDLPSAITRLAAVRQASTALKTGSYQQLHVSHEQLAFYRKADDDAMIVIVNSAEEPVSVSLRLPFLADGEYEDVLNHQLVTVREGVMSCEVWSCWGRIIRV